MFAECPVWLSYLREDLVLCWMHSVLDEDLSPWPLDIYIQAYTYRPTRERIDNRPGFDCVKLQF